MQALGGSNKISQTKPFYQGDQTDEAANAPKIGSLTNLWLLRIFINEYILPAVGVGAMASAVFTVTYCCTVLCCFEVRWRHRANLKKLSSNLTPIFSRRSTSTP